MSCACEPFTVTESADEIFDGEAGATFRAPPISADMVAVGTPFEALRHGMGVWRCQRLRVDSELV